MDINFSSEDLAFRDEVRDFFAREFDAELAQQLSATQGGDYKSAIVSWQKKTLMPRAGSRRAGLKSMAALAGRSLRNLSTRPSVAPQVFPMSYRLV